MIHSAASLTPKPLIWGNDATRVLCVRTVHTSKSQLEHISLLSTVCDAPLYIFI